MSFIFKMDSTAKDCCQCRPAGSWTQMQMAEFNIKKLIRASHVSSTLTVCPQSVELGQCKAFNGCIKYWGLFTARARASRAMVRP